MLSTQSAHVVKATLPVIGGAIGEITPIFYKRMFAAHPELERDLFNRGNQAQGDQQSALAGAIAAYATLLVAEDGRDPLEVLARIAHKHASLGIAEDLYPVVHEHLFAAIVEVLGEAVTPEVASAWDEVYWHMAKALITIETGLVRRVGRGLRRRVAHPGAASSSAGVPGHGVLRSGHSRRQPVAAARPGQYVSVQVALPDGAHQIRQYSLTHAPEDCEWAISVKAVPAIRSDDGAIVPAGEVSNFLHQSLFEGDEIRVSAPFGELVLQESEEPLVLISAGIGITPMIGILHYLVGTGSTREVLVLHADRSPARHAHRQELKELVADLPAGSLHRWYEDLGVRPTRDALRVGRVDLGAVQIPQGAKIYLCGPLPFMESVRQTLVEQDFPRRTSTTRSSGRTSGWPQPESERPAGAPGPQFGASSAQLQRARHVRLPRQLGLRGDLLVHGSRDVLGPWCGTPGLHVDVQEDLLHHEAQPLVGVVEEVDQGVCRSLRTPQEAHARGDLGAGEQLGQVGQVVLGGEARVSQGRPVLRDPHLDQGLVEALAGDAGVVAHVEVTVGVLEGHRNGLHGVGGHSSELLVGGVGSAHEA